MKTFLKWLAILFALAAVLVGVAALLLKIYLPPEKAKALVLKHLSEQLKREVTLGQVSVGIFSGLQMSDLKISESPTFAKGTFLSSQQFSLKVALAPLLSRKIVIKQVLLKKPDVTVIRMADGKRYNFSDLTESTKPADQSVTKTDQNEGQSFSLLVTQAHIEGGALHFIDRSPAKQSVEINPFDLKLENVSLTNPFTLQMATRIQYQGTSVSVRFGGEAHLPAGTFKITSGDITTGQAKITLSGALSELRSDAPSAKLHLATNDVPVKDLLKLAPTAVPQGVILDGTTKLAVDLSGTAAKQSFAVKWDGTSMHVQQADQLDKPSGVPLEISVIGDRAESGVITVKTLGVKLSQNELIGSGTVSPRGDHMIISFSAKGSDWAIEDLAKLSPAVAPFRPSGKLQFDLKATGPSVDPLIVVNTVANIRLAQVKHEYYEGEGLELMWNLSGITPDLSKVSGAADFRQGPGKILQVEKLAASSKAGKIVLAPLDVLAKLQKKGLLSKVELPSFQTIPFDSLLGQYVLRSGVLEMKTFDLVGQDLSIRNRGTVGLAGAQPIHMKVALELAAGAVRGTLGDIMKNDQGRPVVQFAATGTVSNPQVKWDVQAVQKKAVEQIGKEIMKNENVKKAVGDFQKTLDGIFRK